MRSAIKLAIGLAMLVGTLQLLDARLPLDALAHADPRWLLAAVGAWTAAQLASVLRFSFTARRMGGAVPLRFAITQTYVASLLNLTLLSSVGGDAFRISAHGAKLDRGAAGYLLALRTHVVDRFSGQALLLLVTCITLPQWLASQVAQWFTTLGLLIALALGLAIWIRRRATRTAHLSQWLDEGRAALISEYAWVAQISFTSIVVAGCLTTYFCAARALSVTLSLDDLLNIGPLVLSAMALPIGVGGFGPREAASAALFAANGLDPGKGTWVAVVYGLVSLAAALPAIPLWLLSRGRLPQPSTTDA